MITRPFEVFDGGCKLSECIRVRSKRGVVLAIAEEMPRRFFLRSKQSTGNTRVGKINEASMNKLKLLIFLVVIEGLDVVS